MGKKEWGVVVGMDCTEMGTIYIIMMLMMRAGGRGVMKDGCVWAAMFSINVSVRVEYEQSMCILP